MVRSLAVIVWAILQSAPGMSPGVARGYARTVQHEAREHHFDPLTLVAMVHYESHWIASVGNGKCFGLAGVCLDNFRSCRQDLLGAACQAKRAELLDGHANLRAAAAAITANRRFCRAKTGRAEDHHWLASYQGLNKPGRGIFCGQRQTKRGWVDVPRHRLTKRVMARRAWLLARRS